jgi:hypothetical protein
MSKKSPKKIVEIARENQRLAKPLAPLDIAPTPTAPPPPPALITQLRAALDEHTTWLNNYLDEYEDHVVTATNIFLERLRG